MSNINKVYYDPQEYIRQLQSLLVSDKKKIGFFFGAGTSQAIKADASNKSQVPGVTKLTENIIEELKKQKNFKTAFDEIRSELGDNFNIEYILSNVIQKKEIIGKGKLNGLIKEDFDKLETLIKKSIKDQVSVHKFKDEIIENLVHVDFAEWIGRADRKVPIEIFTTNYDFLFEIGLEHKNIPYYDGFVGGFEPFFNALSVEDMNFSHNCTKLWKLHGSLGWFYDKEQNKVLRKNPKDIEDILVYPSILKYSEAKKFPYISLIDRLSNFLKQDDTVLFICGYSFGDAHINEIIASALKTNAISHVYVLYYDEYYNDKGEKCYFLQDNSKLAKMAKETKKISVYGIRSAVIGGVLGEWKLKSKSDIEDTIINKEECEGDENWTGKCSFKLPDFAKFVEFLTSMIIENKEGLEK